MRTKDNICILKYREEIVLSEEERKSYLNNLRANLKDRKRTNTTVGATLWGPKLYKFTTKLAKNVTNIFTEKETEVVVEGQDSIPDKTVIFAFNHQGILDGFVWIPYAKRHTIVLHGAEVNKLLLAAQLNTGLIKVIKGDKENNQGAKKDAISLLLNNHSIAWFPESTWNLSPNKIHLPINYGFIDVARIAGVPIVPVAIECNYVLKNDKSVIDKVYIKFGEKIDVPEYADLSKILWIYEEKMSTMIYELQERKGVFGRRLTDIDKEYAKFLEMSFKNLKLGKLNWSKEKKYIFNGDDDFYLFHNINEYQYDASYCEKDLADNIKYYRTRAR